MRRENSSRLKTSLSESDISRLKPEEVSQDSSAASHVAASEEEKSESLLGKHKGKLAVGAAAMLGVAIFYKWREHQLAKDDPEEYARLRRLKHVIDSEKPKPK